MASRAMRTTLLMASERVFDGDDFAALVVAALRAYPVRQFGLVALRARRRRLCLEEVVRAARAGAGLRMAAFWIWHLELPRRFSFSPTAPGCPAARPSARRQPSPGTSTSPDSGSLRTADRGRDSSRRTTASSESRAESAPPRAASEEPTAPSKTPRRARPGRPRSLHRSEEHTSELQSRFGISYAVFCLKKKKTNHTQTRARQRIV